MNRVEAENAAIARGHVPGEWTPYRVADGKTASVLSCTNAGCLDTAVERDCKIAGMLLFYQCRAFFSADDWERLPVPDMAFLREGEVAITEINRPKLQRLIERIEAGESAIDILRESY